ncbi:MAG TPA: hypothetical protein VFS97_04130 [Nitrososphaeraceae archaeon]|nr:hypothetical protein [Nitrososphaeraceae archaeon]
MAYSSLKTEGRRKKVSALLAQATTEEQIASALGVDQSTISRDIKVLKRQSQQFVYDLAKTDLCFYYKQSIEGIGEVKRKAWESYNNSLDNRIRLLALKLAKECDEAIFSLFSQGPSIMNIKALEDRLEKVEQSSSSG